MPGAMLGDRFDAALVLASDLHRPQKRKGTGTPYVAHLLATCALVLENGGDEAQAIAALLHDAVEDQGGLETAKMIRARFGARVADIVLACSDSTDQASEPWHLRKERYLESLRSKSPDALLVTTCDKLHNATAILNDLETVGPAVFDRFTAGRAGTLWYYRALADRLLAVYPGPLSQRFAATVGRIEDTARNPKSGHRFPA